MKRKCCVPTCNSRSKCAICQVDLSYFKVPRDPLMIKKWELALSLKDQSLHSRDRVCSSHFKKIDIIRRRFICLKRPCTNSKMILETSKLERHAIPSVFRQEMKPCPHGGTGRDKKLMKPYRKVPRSETASNVSESSQDEESDSTSDGTKESHGRFAEKKKQLERALKELEDKILI